MNRARRLGEELLPKGRLDAARQVLLFVGAYVLYQLVRGTVDGSDLVRAYWNAIRVIHLERRLHVFVEPSIQHWMLQFHWFTDLATWFYLNGNYAITGGVLLWVYLRRNDSFYFVRNMFLVAMVIALAGYALYPTMPPRLLPEWGFVDTVRQVTGVNAEQSSASVFVNLYAAIPSMHVCFALMTGLPMVRFTHNRAARVLWALYPLFVALVVIATANHFLTDAVLGAVTAGVAALTAKQLFARVRPEVWAFAGRRAEA
jgi:hypothetical protein